MSNREKLGNIWYKRGRVLKEKDLKDGLIVWAYLHLYNPDDPGFNCPISLIGCQRAEGWFWMLGNLDYDYEPVGSPEEDCHIGFPEGELTLFEAVR